MKRESYFRLTVALVVLIGVAMVSPSYATAQMWGRPAQRTVVPPRKMRPLKPSKIGIKRNLDPQQITEMEEVLWRGEGERLRRVRQVTRWKTSPTPSERQAGLPKIADAELRRLRACRGSCLPRMARLEIGAIGVLRDPDSATTPGQAFMISPEPKLYSLEVVRVVNENEMLARTPLTRASPNRYGGPQRMFVWLKGFVTKGHIKGRYSTIGYAVKVTGTTQCTTVKGRTETVFVLEPFPIHPEAL